MPEERSLIGVLCDPVPELTWSKEIAVEGAKAMFDFMMTDMADTADMWRMVGADDMATALEVYVELKTEEATGETVDTSPST